MRARGGAAAVGLGASMLALLGALALSGHPPGGRMLERFEPGGIVALGPAAVCSVEIRTGGERFAFRRTAAGRWAREGARPDPLSDELAAHLETALRFLHVAAPTRILGPQDRGGASLADFGLDPPAAAVSLVAAGGAVATADFGALNPARTSQYVRLLGGPALYLLPRHVGAEWRLAADLAARSLPASAGRSRHLLLPASIDRIAAVEIVAAGRFRRFERDRAGDWFLHTGQHSHAGNAPAHVADPAWAPAIAAALAAFADAEIESVAADRAGAGERARFGLERPVLIALFYPADSSTPLARVEIGGTAQGGFGRYAQLSRDGQVVTIAAGAPARLIELLQAGGPEP